MKEIEIDKGWQEPPERVSAQKNLPLLTGRPETSSMCNYVQEGPPSQSVASDATR